MAVSPGPVSFVTYGAQKIFRHLWSTNLSTYTNISKTSRFLRRYAPVHCAHLYF
jgi:hypothetical protein